MYDVVALGELLIDFTSCKDKSSQGNPLMEANPGGAPGNAMAMLSRLGRKTAFISKVGDDYLGHLLYDTVKSVGIDPSGILFDDEVPTTLAFVATGEGGERSFSFYRNPGADVMLKAEEVPLQMVRDTKIFHIGTLSMTHPGVYEATCLALEEAKAGGALISVDPNYRESLWPSPEAAIEKIWFALSKADIIKISDNEIELLTGETDPDKGIAKIREKCPAKLVCATLGPDGSIGYFGDLRVFAAPFKMENTIETTGAGDTFTGCMLNAVLTYGLDGLNEENLHSALEYANAAAAIITTKAGALKVMPERQEIDALVAKRH